MKSYAGHVITLYGAVLDTFKSTIRLHQTVTRPPGLERRIFKTCALESPESCTVLVLVARRMNERSVR